MNTAQRRYRHTDLVRWASSCFRVAGAAGEDADETARVLVRTNLRGIDTHGVSRIPGYVEKMLAGEVNVAPKPRSEFRNGVVLFDGDGGLGQSVAMQAVRESVARAADQAAVTCFIRGSGHLAALGQFVLEAAEQGLVAMLCQETPPLMALEGSSRPSIGNNPIAFAFPVAGDAPGVFDMASSVVARGNLLQAISDERESIPGHWAIGPDGRPTEDPKAALQGAMLPIAGHKGVGLAMMVQILAGSLTGSLTAASASKHGASSSAGNVSAFLLVLNPDLLAGRQAYDAHVRHWLDSYLAASGEGSRFPGQRAAECEADRLRTGIPVPESTVKALSKLGASLGVAFDLPQIVR